MGAVPTDEVVKGRTAQGLLDVARGVIAELDLDVVLDRVLESARKLTGARYAALGVLNESRTELSRFRHRRASRSPRTPRSASCRADGACWAS